jgi:S1-C subfamily serine protease
MMARALSWIVLTAFAGAFPVLSQSEAGRCPDGGPEKGDLGIVSLVCIGEACEVNRHEGRNNYIHDFPTEPRVEGIDPNGPAAGKLRRGDVLVAINGALITTREGGLRLANLAPGSEITLTIRREGVQKDVRIVSRPVCLSYRVPMKGAFVLLAPALQRDPRRPPVPEDPRRRVKPNVDFGMELECSDCGWRPDATGWRGWYSSGPPIVRRVEPGGPASRAGVQPGDVLLGINGIRFDTDAIRSQLQSLRPGQPTTLTLGRKGAIRNITVVPRALPKDRP